MNWFRRFRFWKRVRDYATRKMGESYRAPSLKCPTCRRWTWETEIVSFRWEGDIAHMTCGGCEHTSRWRDIGIILIPEPDPTPTTKTFESNTQSL